MASSGGGSAPSTGDAVAAYIIDRTQTSPNGSEEVGWRYIIPSGADGVWTGKDGQIATLTTSGWTYAEPVSGQLAYIENENRLTVYSMGGPWLNSVL